MTTMPAEEFLPQDPGGFSNPSFERKLARSYQIIIQSHPGENDCWHKIGNTTRLSGHKTRTGSVEAGMIEESSAKNTPPSNEISLHPSNCTSDANQLDEMSKKFDEIDLSPIDVWEVIKVGILGKGMDTGIGTSPDFPVIKSNHPTIFEDRSSRYHYELPPHLPIIQSETYQSGPQRANNTDLSTSAKAQIKVTVADPTAPALNREKSFLRPALVERRIGLERMGDSAKDIEAGNETASFELHIPKGILDLTFWIPAKLFSWRPDSIRHFMFSTREKNNSPYLSVVFDDLYHDIRPAAKLDHELYVRHRLAVYGATALYNRHKFRADANATRAKAIRNAKAEPPQSMEVDNCEILHFGMTFHERRFEIYVFEIIYKPGGKGEWAGCRMNVIEDGDMRDAGFLRILLERYRAILDWAKTRYVDGLRKDIELCLPR